MKQPVQQFYASMLDDLQHCKGKQTIQIAAIECCFQTCIKHWRQVRDSIMHHEFSSQDEEIDFFKLIKPLFTSKIQYYNLLYHAQLFEPEHGTKGCRTFWQREAHRLEKLKEEHGSFYEYYKSGRTCNDKVYFTRLKREAEFFLEGRIYDMDTKLSSSHDYLVASIMALEAYAKYVEERMKEVSDTHL